VSRAHWGDLTGMNLAGLVRLSFELDADAADESEIDTSPVRQTGRDIKGKGEQEKDCRSYVERRKGSYVYTYVEPSTSAWKRKRVSPSRRSSTSTCTSSLAAQETAGPSRSSRRNARGRSSTATRKRSKTPSRRRTDCDFRASAQARRLKRTVPEIRSARRGPLTRSTVVER
jgi:hypothetical protein